MSSYAAVFTQSSSEFAFNATTASRSVTTAGFTQGGPVLRVFNPGASALHVQASVSALGSVTAAFPTEGSPSPGYTVAPGAVEIFGIPANADTLNFLVASGTTTFYVSRGDGL